MLAAVVTVGSLRGAPPVPADRLVALAPSVPGTPLTLAVFGTSLTARSRWPEAVAAGLQSCLNRPVSLVRVAEEGGLQRWGLHGGTMALAQDVDADILQADGGGGLIAFDQGRSFRMRNEPPQIVIEEQP